MNRIDVDVRGPLFDGRAPAIVAQMARDAEEAIAAQAYAEVMTNLNSSIRIPTPYYETQITVENLAAHGKIVHDRGIVYGPWLEKGSGEGRVDRPSSVGRPNVQYPPRAGRFPGYHSFSRAARKVQAQAPALTEHAVQRRIRELGG